MATQTPASKARTGGPPAAKSRILRIGIVQGGRIVEERLIRKRENISIGWSSKATFAVPSEALPKQWMLFEAHPKGYIAHFADAMDARIGLDLLAKGHAYKEIAERLQISYGTVHTYIERIYKKLHVRSRAQAVAVHLRK